MKITGKTKQLAVLGNPIEHSHSPLIHNYISDKLNIDCVYSALKIKKNSLKEALYGVKAMNFLGVNITSPFKFEALSIMDELSQKAKKFSSVNTCVNKNGKLYGYNTDADGFYRSLLHENVDVNDKDILFIGAGGATQPVIVYLSELGVRSIDIYNRTEENAKKLAMYVKSTTDFDCGIGMNKKHYDIVINTTTVGMYPNINASPISDYSFIDENTIAYDMIYNPEETLFLKNAKKRGAKTINGLGMLIYQGILAYELFCDIKLDDSIYDEILKEVFKR